MSLDNEFGSDYDKIKPFIDKAYLLNNYELEVLKNKKTFEEKLNYIKNKLGVTKDTHQLKGFRFSSAEEASFKFFSILMDPDNFPYTCKLLFNIDLHPFQHVILKELWTKSFPMIIGGRGCGKTFLLSMYCMLRLLFNQGCKVAIVGGGFRQAKAVFNYMEELWYKGPVYRDICKSAKDLGREQGPKRSVDRWDMNVGESIGFALPLGDGCVNPSTITTYGDFIGTVSSNCTEKITKTDVTVWGNGKFRNSDESYYNGLKPTKIITTKKGFSIEGTYNHGIKVLRNGKIDWVRFDEMKIGDRVLIDKSERWHSSSSSASEDEFYAFGLLTGNGCWTQDSKISYSTIDKETIESLNKVNFNFKQLKKDPIHFVFHGKENVSKWKSFWQISNERSHQKEFTKTVLKGSKKQVASFISGLYDTDGHVQVSTKKGGTSITIGFTTTSKKLADYLHYILLHYGIVSCKTFRDRNPKHNRCYEILICGQNCIKFKDEINFRVKRKRDILESAISQKIKSNSFDGSIPIDKELLLQNAIDNWKNSKKDFSVYFNRIRQLKSFTKNFLLRYIDNYPENDFTKHISSLIDDSIYFDEVKTIEDSQCETYDIHVPEGNEYCANGFFSHNSRIRGQRAGYLICDEYASISEEIFNDAVLGFAAVSTSPMEKVKREYRVKFLKAFDMWTNKAESYYNMSKSGNQVVLSGTADYTMGHFYKTYKLYESVIKCNDNPKKIKEVFGDKNPGMSAKKCSIIRLPSSVLPEGFMDPDIIATARAKLSASQYQKEYDATFPVDSDGFYKMSLIKSCTCPIKDLYGDEFIFDPQIMGDPKSRYVMSVDPASEKDKLAIVILELFGNVRKVVYCWSINRKEFKNRVLKGILKEHDYFKYCVSKIRELFKKFNVVRIACDTGGGGIQIEEALANPEKDSGLMPIYRVKDPEDTKNPKYTDELPGFHILEMIQFSSAKWTSEANHNMKADMENKTLLFPYFDMVSEEIAIQEDKEKGNVYIDEDGEEIRIKDSYISLVEEIEEMKKELVSISHSRTPAGREKWDLPSIKNAEGKKITQTKDRYSALLMANAIARLITIQENMPQQTNTSPIGGTVKEILDSRSTDKKHAMYKKRPDWMKDTSGYGAVVRR